jgi:hypothetical protein
MKVVLPLLADPADRKCTHEPNKEKKQDYLPSTSTLICRSLSSCPGPKKEEEGRHNQKERKMRFG